MILATGALTQGPIPISIPVVAIIDDDDSVRDSVSSLIRSVSYKTALFASAEAYLNSQDQDRENPQPFDS